MCGDRVRASEVCLLLSASCVEAVCAICTPLNAWTSEIYGVRVAYNLVQINLKFTWRLFVVSLLQYCSVCISHFQWHNPLCYYLTNWRRRRQLINNTNRVEEKWTVDLFFWAFNLHRTHRTHSWTSWSKSQIDSFTRRLCTAPFAWTNCEVLNIRIVNFRLNLFRRLCETVVFLSLFSFKLKSTTTTATLSNPIHLQIHFDDIRCSWLLYVLHIENRARYRFIRELLQVFYLRKTHSLAGRPVSQPAESWAEKNNRECKRSERTEHSLWRLN